VRAGSPVFVLLGERRAGADELLEDALRFELDLGRELGERVVGAVAVEGHAGTHGVGVGARQSPDAENPGACSMPNACAT